MAAEWTRLHPEAREECASVSCGHSPASWRMDAGGTGSFFCGDCRDKITGLGNMKDLMMPILDAKDERIAQLEAALSGIVNHWREFGSMIVLSNAVNRDDYGMDERVEAAAELVK